MVPLILDALLVVLLAKMDMVQTQVMSVSTAEMVQSLMASFVIQTETVIAFLVLLVREEPLL